MFFFSTFCICFAFFSPPPPPPLFCACICCCAISRTLDGEQAAVDLGQTPAELVFLSFADSDLAAAAAAWEAMPAGRPGLRLANLARLRHPMSVDLYAEQVVARARCVVVRLLGGLEYWRYGAEEIAALCRPPMGSRWRSCRGMGGMTGGWRSFPPCRREARDRLEAYLRHGGPENLAQALRLAAALGGLEAGRTGAAGAGRAGRHPRPDAELKPGRPGWRCWCSTGRICWPGTSRRWTRWRQPCRRAASACGRCLLSSLKDAEAACFVAARLRAWRPSVVLNATAFSAAQGGESPLDVAGVPVLQVVLAGAARDAWANSARGLSQADLAMQVVLPELDGRLLTTAVSFKAEAAPVAGLEFARTVHCPDAEGIALAADRALGWARLAATPAGERHIAVVLSDYPGAGGGQVGHAVGLDSFASLDEVLSLLGLQGYDTGGAAPTAALLTQAPPAPVLSLAAYETLFATLPAALRARILASWGEAAADPAVAGGAFALRHARCGNFLVAVQPDRGSPQDRRASYHDPDLPPRHAYVAFYLWLRASENIHALVHLGTHGTLEWLPGKAVTLSAGCAPVALLAGCR